MFRNETAFLLGAGASWHYGYPTGEMLISQAINMAKRIRNYCRSRIEAGFIAELVPEYVLQARDPELTGPEQQRQAWFTVIKECESLISRLETVRPLVIDYFLGWNNSLRPIGRLIIAAVILECEEEERRTLQKKIGSLHRTSTPIAMTGIGLLFTSLFQIVKNHRTFTKIKSIS